MAQGVRGAAVAGKIAGRPYCAIIRGSRCWQVDPSHSATDSSRRRDLRRTRSEPRRPSLPATGPVALPKSHYGAAPSDPMVRHVIASRSLRVGDEPIRLSPIQDAPFQILAVLQEGSYFSLRWLKPPRPFGRSFTWERTPFQAHL